MKKGHLKKFLQPVKKSEVALYVLAQLEQERVLQSVNAQDERHHLAMEEIGLQ